MRLSFLEFDGSWLAFVEFAEYPELIALNFGFHFE